MAHKMHDDCCPKCGSINVTSRTVSDRVAAVDRRGYIFEMNLQLPVRRCNACKFGWQGREALAAKEAAYQIAVKKRSQSGQWPGSRKRRTRPRIQPAM